MSLLNKMGLCEMYAGKTAEQLYQLAQQYQDTFNQRSKEKDAAIKTLDETLRLTQTTLSSVHAQMDESVSIANGRLSQMGRVEADLKKVQSELDAKTLTVKQCLKENAELSERVIAQAKELTDLKAQMTNRQTAMDYTTSKLQQLRDAVAHIELCVKEAKGI